MQDRVFYFRKGHNMKKTYKFTVLAFILLVCESKAQWMQIAVNTDGLASIFFTSPDTGFVAGESANILRTYDGGGTWTNVHSGGPGIAKINFVDADTGYALAEWDELHKSTNKGSTWSTSMLPSGATYCGLEFYNPALGFVSGQDASGAGTILKSTDYGVTWTPQSFLPLSRITDIDMVTPTTGYGSGYTFLSSYNGLIYKTTDGGTSWTGQLISSPAFDEIHFDCVFFIDSLRGYVAGTSIDTLNNRAGIIFKTVDAGTTWMPQVVPLASYLMDLQFVDDTTAYIAGTLNGSSGCGTSIILKTIDAGASWATENTGPPIYGINSLSFPNRDRGYALEKCSGPGAVGGILKFDVNEDCFAYYGVSVDSATSTFTLFIDSTTSAQAVSYFWDFGDGTTSTLATPSHVVSIDTAYNVCMKIFTATGDSCQYCHLLGKDYLSNIIRDPGYTINVTDSNSIAGIASFKKPRLFVYPNPGEGIFNLKGNSEEGVVSVYDVTGRMLLRKNVVEEHFSIDLTGENSGIYILEYTTRENVFRVKLVRK